MVAYNAAISACEKGSQWRVATQLLRKEWSERPGKKGWHLTTYRGGCYHPQATPPSIDPSVGRLLPDLVSITAITAALERCEASDLSGFCVCREVAAFCLNFLDHLGSLDRSIGRPLNLSLNFFRWSPWSQIALRILDLERIIFESD